MPWIGLDDTDTLSGGCTTHEFHLLIEELTNLSNEGKPWTIPTDNRLVRLWPFASKRTRGNAALGTKIEIKKEDEQELHLFLDDWFKRLLTKISKLEVIQSHHSKREQTAPEPCLIFSRNQYPEYYWEAVRTNVDYEYASTLIKKDTASKIWGIEGKMSGLIGALAAISWVGSEDQTWELTAYREEQNYSLKRVLDSNSVKQMSVKYSNTILNRDPNSDKSIIAPNTPCPVLYGIRSECPKEVKNAHEFLQSNIDNEKCKSFQIWRTNQATGDHIGNEYVSKLKTNPKINKGGHALIEVETILPKNDLVILIAFEETGPLNKLANTLKKDDVIGWQGLRSPSGEFHLERLKLIQGAPRGRKRPKCSCGGKLKSAGKNQPLRCEECNLKFPRLWKGERKLPGSWVEPNPSERRHLAKPLNRN